MDGEDHRVAARLVVEHRLDRCVRVDAAVPVGLAVDAHRRKRRRQRAGCHDVLQADRFVATVEIAHFSVLDVHRADGQARLAVIEIVEIDELGECRAQRGCRVVRRIFQPDLQMGTEPRLGVGAEKRRKPIGHGRHMGQRCRQCGETTKAAGAGALLDSAPELVQCLEAAVGGVAGNQCAVDRADRCADHPIRLDACLMQRLVDADLVGAQRAATLHDQNHLAGQGWGVACAVGALLLLLDRCCHDHVPLR